MRLAPAVSDGYRRLGTVFPGMGEHWLHPGVLVSGAIDAARPAVDALLAPPHARAHR